MKFRDPTSRHVRVKSVIPLKPDIRLTVGSKVSVQRQGASEMIPGIVTELLPLGPFASWQAERAIGAHDLNTLRVRIDLLDNGTKFEPGMTVWLDR